MDDKVAEALRSLGVAEDELAPDVLAGLRTAASKPPRQIGRDELRTMKPEDVVAAEQAGKLDTLLGRKAN